MSNGKRKKPHKSVRKDREAEFEEVDFTKKDNGGVFDDVVVEFIEYTEERNQFNKLVVKRKNIDTGEENSDLRLH